MKVVVVGSLAYSLVNFRLALLADMVRHGHNVTACAPEFDPEVVDTLANVGVRYRRIPMLRASLSPLSDLLTLYRLVQLFRSLRPDIVLAYTQKPIIYAGLAARIVGRCDFYAMVSGLGYVFSDSCRSKILRACVSLLYRMGVKNAKAVIVFNGDDRQEMVANGILRPDHRVVQVPGSGVDTQRFVQRPIPAGYPKFLLVARLLRDKGLKEFVEAARQVRPQCPDARFQILGPLDENPMSISKSELEIWTKEGIVEYLGETRDVAPYLAGSTVFVLPTYYREGLPRTLLEAMATGRAIVTTDTPGCRETVTAGGNGFLVPPRDSAALAAAMMEFVHDPELAQKMGIRSREFAERRFAINRVNGQLLETIGLNAVSVRLDDSVETGYHGRSATTAALHRVAGGLVALVGAVTLFPIMLVIACMVALTMGLPIFFTQMRVGKDGVPFRLIKFRTMTNARDSDGRLMDDALRTGPLGRFLRRFRLDELPQLWNILAGDMGLIGPRPLPTGSPTTLGRSGDLRSAVPPGLTGWAQVNGNSLLDADKKLQLDLWYIENASLTLDLKIIARTIAVLVFGERVTPLALEQAGESYRRRFG